MVQKELPKVLKTNTLMDEEPMVFMFQDIKILMVTNVIIYVALDIKEVLVEEIGIKKWLNWILVVISKKHYQDQLILGQWD
ncbi:hypothetical protein D3C85_1561850 [compost metagenome]